MAVILGIDLGTQSVKGMLIDTNDQFICVDSEEYPLMIPHPGWAVEDPEQWWNATSSVIKRLNEKSPQRFNEIDVVGLSGQMHGVVPLDQNNKPVCNAITWVDQRSKSQVREIEDDLGRDELAFSMHNHVFTGFGFPSLLWIKQECPDDYLRIRKICSPKDYIRYCLIEGTIETDSSDASSMTGFDFAERSWNYKIIEKFGLDSDIFPKCHESTAIAGEVSDNCARETGLKKGIPVVYGSGDLAAVCLGCGLYKEGYAIVNIGTGGNYNCYSSMDRYDRNLRMQEFCNAINGAYILSGAMLSGGLSLSWIKDKILQVASYDELNEIVTNVPPGSDGLVFLPYLGGERAPHMDMDATGMFFGLRHLHGRGHFCRAVMEGVTFALKDAQEVLNENGIINHTLIASGGGAKSDIWLQMQADILERDIIVTKVDEEACLGACMIAGIGTGIFKDAEDACRELVTYDGRRFVPNKNNFDVYRHRYEIYRSLYPQLKQLMKNNGLK